jgi:hypothetical protein
MITHWDEGQINRDTSEEAGSDGVIHVQHFADGMPLCWDQGRTGAFSGSFKEEEITCEACLDFAGIPKR